jgi:predicted lipoprotein with Yx(FWY)xxD motif
MGIVAFLISLLAASSPAPMTAHQAAPARAKGAIVMVRKTSYGRILVDGRGLTLYLFTRDATPKSRCYGDCAKAWPPLVTKGKPRAGKGAKASLVGSTTRNGGRRQVTYDGHPLYRYVGDRKPGDVFCQDVNEFGGTWLIVSPGGAAVR